MSGIPITIPGSTTSGGLQMGFFFKMSYTTYNTPVLLVQLGLPCSGYITIYLNTNNTIVAACNATGNGGNWSNSVSSTGGISAVTWYYVTYCLGYSSPNLCQRLYVYQAGTGWFDGGQQSLGAAVTADTNVTATLGVGVNVINNALSFAGFQNFHNLPGCQISKFWLRNGNATGIAGGGPSGVNALPLPMTDNAIATMSPVPLLFYNCRQAIPVLSPPGTPVVSSAPTGGTLGQRLGPPAAPAPTTAATGGTLAAGAYGVVVTYVNPAGETLPSAAGTVTTTGATSTITIPAPVASGDATGWYAYVTQAGGSTYTLQQTAGAPTGLGTSLVLSAPPTSTGAAPPAASTAWMAYGVELTYTNLVGEMTVGETMPSVGTSVTPTAATSALTISSPLAAAGATGWYAYVTQAGGGSYTRQQQAGYPTPIGTNLTLSAAPTTTGVGPPTSNSASQNVTSLIDNSGNGYNLTAGPQGLQVLADGPYA